MAAGKEGVLCGLPTGVLQLGGDTELHFKWLVPNLTSIW